MKVGYFIKSNLLVGEIIISVSFRWLNHTNATEENDFISEQSTKVCSIESELGQKIQVTSSVNRNARESFCS